MADNAVQGLLSDPRGEMRASPRNKLMGLLADALGSANQFATQNDPRYADKRQNQTLGLLADAVSLGSLAKTADRMSYGAPLTNARQANVPWLKPETADALMMAPISPRMTLGALGMGMGADTGSMRAIFAGITAKTADKTALAQAEKLTASGADPRKTWKDTGWMKGGDGKWRFEIDDTRGAMRLNGPKYGTAPLNALGETVDHREAYKAYPNMKKTYATWADVDGRGSYNPGTGAGEAIDLPRQSTPSVQRSVALHEMQHAVQQREGFARGGNQGLFNENLDEDGSVAKAADWAAAEVRQRRERIKVLRKDGRDQYGEDWRDSPLGRQASAIEAEIATIQTTPNTFNAYKLLAGEAEARAVQSRMNLTPQQRREMFPLDSYDVPVNSLIYR